DLRLFFRLLEVVVKARKIPATLACGVRVSSGEHEAGRQVASRCSSCGRSCGCRSLSGRGFVLVLMNGYRGALVGTGGAETARPPLQWPSRVVCCGGVTSVPGSGDRPGTVTRVARRPGGGVRCCRT